MSKTDEDLKAGFAGESQANRRYLAFAKKADEEGLPKVAKLFRAAAHAETIHALNHLRAMGGVNSTVENLKAAIAGENYEYVSMYPEFVHDAEAESAKRALTSFRWAMAVEKVHETLYTQALTAVQGEGDLPDADYYVCSVCGFTHAGPIEGKCPVCGTPAERFEVIK